MKCTAAVRNIVDVFECRWTGCDESTPTAFWLLQPSNIGQKIVQKIVVSLPRLKRADAEKRAEGCGTSIPASGRNAEAESEGARPNPKRVAVMPRPAEIASVNYLPAVEDGMRRLRTDNS